MAGSGSAPGDAPGRVRPQRDDDGDDQIGSSAAALRFLRIAVGVLFLIFAEYKVAGTSFTLHGGYEGWIHRFLDGGAAYPFMVPLLRGVALPYHTPIAFVVAYGELVLGIALVLGRFVRAVSIGGLAYMLVLLLSSNYPGAHAPLWEYFGASLDHLVLALCFIAFIIERAGSRTRRR